MARCFPRAFSLRLVGNPSNIGISCDIPTEEEGDAVGRLAAEDAGVTKREECARPVLEGVPASVVDDPRCDADTVLE